MYRRTHQAVDEATLQTDVMRFMAIVAFCLVAILAVVRNVDAPPPTQPQQAAERPVPDIKPAVATPAPQPVASVQAETSPAVPIATAEPTETRSEPVSSNQVAELVAPAEPAESAEPAVSADPVTPDTTDTEQGSPTDEQGLGLSFVSDADFLRLVNKGTVQVFAYRQANFLRLNNSYLFAPSEPPHQVYELQSDTIPELLRAALQVDGARHYQWAVVLPTKVTRQIEQYVRNETRGTLKIDRYQQVHHAR